MTVGPFRFTVGHTVIGLSTVDEIIQHTADLEGTWTLSRLEQTMLLEVNAVDIFSALSLRCSKASQKPSSMMKLLPFGKDQTPQHCFWVIPEKRYLKCCITGEGSSRSNDFGIPLKDVLSKACHERHFDCFAACVQHTEFIADTIARNGLLRFPKRDKVDNLGRFESARCLSFFVCYNTVVFLLAGKDMRP